MSLLLCIETSTTNCSISLSENGKCIAIKEDNNTGYSHSESLHVFIEELLAEQNVSINQLSAIVVSKGPGSYTGLRIGVSAAKGLCYALDIPLIAINTLDSLAAQVSETEKCYIVPMLDARRMEVYTATYTQNLTCVEATKAYILDETSYSDLLEKQTTIFIGNGVAKFQEICSHPNAKFITQTTPSAKQLCQLGWTKFEKKDFEDVAYFEPFYLKDFVAGVKKKG